MTFLNQEILGKGGGAGCGGGVSSLQESRASVYIPLST